MNEARDRLRSARPVSYGPSRPRSVRTRRFLDLALVIGASPVWVPLAAGVALSIVASSGRPIFFVQTRTGHNGEPFPMIKFRSMTTGPNPLVPTDAHITDIGRVLRRTSLDELPQLLNVLHGSMSLVGPRPMLPAQSDQLSRRQQLRLQVRPGLTGFAQVSGRNSLRWSDRIELDLQWVARSTVGNYLRTLARTAMVVRSQDGVDGHCATDEFVDLTAAEHNASDSRVLLDDQAAV